MGLLFPKKKKKKKKKSRGLFWLSAIVMGVIATGGGSTAVFTHHGGGSVPQASGSLAAFQTCVINAESGGDPTVWNKQGYPYWGLYQFGRPLWVGNGGNPADWGQSSTPASEQTQIFFNVMSHYKGCENWTPSDHCSYPANGCN